MSFFPGNDPQPGDAFACDAIETLIIPNAKDIGGFDLGLAAIVSVTGSTAGSVEWTGFDN